MSTGLLFWILYVLAVITGAASCWPAAGGQQVGTLKIGGNLILLILLFLLGWHVFGFVIQDSGHPVR